MAFVLVRRLRAEMVPEYVLEWGAGLAYESLENLLEFPKPMVWASGFVTVAVGLLMVLGVSVSGQTQWWATGCCGSVCTIGMKIMLCGGRCSWCSQFVLYNIARSLHTGGK